MKTNFKCVEDAYQALASDILAFPNGREWTSVIGSYSIFSRMVSSTWWLENGNAMDRKWNDGDESFNRLACDAALFLRDDLLRTTGQRIWGLTFTLYPDGKFNIEYDYNKPEDYEETDEVITGNEINQSLGALGKPD